MAGFGIEETFVQDNESRSVSAGTVRGLHFQVDPHAQGKLVRVLRGAIFDVALDLRPDSPTYLQHSTIELAEDDFVLDPAGFAHGFCTLEPTRRRVPRRYYHRDAEQSILWNDPELGIEWPISQPTPPSHQGHGSSVLRRLPSRELT